MSRLDLHLHTTCSDGSHTPTAVVELARKARVSALAITDHDTVSGLPEAIEAGRVLGLEVIPGIELSSRWGKSGSYFGIFFELARRNALSPADSFPGRAACAKPTHYREAQRARSRYHL